MELRAALETIRLLNSHYPRHSIWLEGDALRVNQKLQIRDSSDDYSILMNDA